MKKRADLYVEEEVLDWLNKKADKEHLSFSTLVRKMLWEKYEEGKVNDPQSQD